MNPKPVIEKWIEKATEEISQKEKFIAEVEDMIGSDYSRHRTAMERSQKEISFLETGIKIMKSLLEEIDELNDLLE